MAIRPPSIAADSPMGKRWNQSKSTAIPKFRSGFTGGELSGEDASPSQAQRGQNQARQRSGAPIGSNSLNVLGRIIGPVKENLYGEDQNGGDFIANSPDLEVPAFVIAFLVNISSQTDET